MPMAARTFQWQGLVGNIGVTPTILGIHMKKQLITLAAICAVTFSLLSPVSSANAEGAVVVKIFTGKNHNCALTSSNEVRCWGDNSAGQTTVPADLGPVTQVSAGYFHTCAISSSVRCWGSNGDGQSSVPSDLGQVTKISAGYFHTCATTVSGSVRCWGSNGSGQRSVPVSLGQVTEISAGNYHSCAINASGNAICWGSNSNGQSTIPTDLGKVTQISAGAYFSCAITISKLVRCWGDNSYGQTQVPVNLGEVTQLASGSEDQACAVRLAGTLSCWGYNDAGETQVPADLGQVSQVATGATHTCALLSVGQVRCWGDNKFGQTDALFLETYSLPATPQNVTATADAAQARVSWTYPWEPAFGSVTITATSNPGGLSCQAIYSDKGCTVYGLANGTIYTFSVVAVNSKGSSQIATTDRVSPKLRWQNAKSYKITGENSLGKTLTVTSSDYWDPDPVSVSTEWLRDGFAIEGATGSSYLVGFQDVGSSISARVTASHPQLENYVVYTPAVAIANRSFTFANSTCPSGTVDTSAWQGSVKQPTITGQSRYTQSVTGQTGTWPTKTKLCYFWYSAGAVIPAATSKTLKLVGTNIGKNIQFVAVGTSPTGVSSIRFSDLVSVKNATFTKAITPSVTGAAKFGSTLKGSVKSWNKGATYSYQWLRNGDPISSATTLSYKLDLNDLGDSISLRMCANQWGYDSMCLSSKEAGPVLGATFPIALKVSIQGASTKVGSSLSAIFAGNTVDANFSIAWLRDGTPIPGATNQSYKLVQADKGRAIGLRVIFSKPGYLTTIKLATAKKIP
jgi:alpha-tubulin suppressor-like RCC1 family protein